MSLEGSIRNTLQEARWDTPFLRHFWRSLWRQANTELHYSSAYHPQTDGQTEVVNRSLGKLLHCLVLDNTKSWDTKLPQAEFSHNSAVNHSTDYCPFFIVYGLIPCGPTDLLPLPAATPAESRATSYWDELMKIHGTTRARLESSNASYKRYADEKHRHVEFEVGDLVWAVLTKDHFPAHEYNKLASQKIGPVEIMAKINLNAYRIHLPAGLRTSNVFNVKHLVPYIDGERILPDSRTNRSGEGGNDGEQIAN
ncbi:hypothetical protein OROMI_000941 [Orobanche minor]